MTICVALNMIASNALTVGISGFYHCVGQILHGVSLEDVGSVFRARADNAGEPPSDAAGVEYLPEPATETVERSQI